MKQNTKYFLISLGIILLAVGILFAMGRLAFCKCDIIALWSSDTTSNQQSQQFSDPYTVTHILHGVIFYFFLWMIFGRRLNWKGRLVLAIAIESAWEIFENTDFIINRYREETISYDYYGDSLFNVLGDILAMIVGFYASWKLPVKITILGALLMDALLLLLI